MSTLDSPLVQPDRRLIEAILPHRPPFLFVERITDRSGDRLEARFTVPADAAIWPGAAVIEGLAQCAQLAVSLEVMAAPPMGTNGQTGDTGGQMAAAGLVGRIQATVHGPVAPGEVLDYAVERRQVLGAMMRFWGQVTVDGRPIVEATLVATRRVG